MITHINHFSKYVMIVMPMVLYKHCQEKFPKKETYIKKAIDTPRHGKKEKQ